MSTDSENENSDESPQEDLRQDEVVGETSPRTKLSRAFGTALIVIVGLGLVALVSIIGDFSGLFQEGSSALNSAARAEPFFGGLISFLGTLGILLVAGIVFTVVGIVALIFMAIFGIGLFSATASDKPKEQRTARKIARVFGITVLSVFGLAFVAISIMVSIDALRQEQKQQERLDYGESRRQAEIDYKSTKIARGLISAKGPKAAVTSYYLKFGKFPTSFDEAGHQIDTTTFGFELEVQSITLGERGKIAVEYMLGRVGLGSGDAILTMVPEPTESGDLRWSCVPDAEFARLSGYLPVECRP